MSWHDFERLRGELEQARDTRLDVEDPAVDEALDRLAHATAILDGGRDRSISWQPDQIRRHDGHVPRHRGEGRARRWRR